MRLQSASGCGMSMLQSDDVSESLLESFDCAYFSTFLRNRQFNTSKQHVPVSLCDKQLKTDVRHQQVRAYCRREYNLRKALIEQQDKKRNTCIWKRKLTCQS